MTSEADADGNRKQHANAALFRHPLWIVGRVVDVVSSVFVLAAIVGAIVAVASGVIEGLIGAAGSIAVAALLRWWGNKFNTLAREGVAAEYS
ncbi:hypothetical protein nbrc107696_15240 [Gordonia spumicola]|uniref:Uncharacterized protein n=1 Tax=Gordonia spumicola TaxID=589161 RepID=A0A7I9V6S4_9ACTN|nr:hypothetical protein [Gordonia spumicola]GEE01078.1 hypothetical protein nbrc107696_15240 [Gordonia spumicola]